MSTVAVEHCVEVLRKKLRTDQFSIISYRVELNEQFLGFCSSQAKLVISATVSGQNVTHHFFVKATTEKPDLNQKFWSVQRLFLKESVVREKLIPELSKYAMKKITADMYCADPENLIILEDLKNLGYELCRKECPDLEHARICMKALANFHGASITLQENSKESLRTRYKNVLYETLLTFPNGRNSPCLLYSIVSHLRILADQLITHIDSEIKTKIIDLAIDRIQSFVQPSKKHLNVICHGDAWGNNVLYNYDCKGNPIDALLVDFQVVRYAPPAIDIVHYIYSSFTHEFRSSHFNRLVEIYYETLSDYLFQRKITIDDILTEKAFLQSIEDFKEFGVLIKAFYMMTRLPGETLSMMSESQEKYLDALIYGGTAIFDHAFQASEEYKKDIVESMGDLFSFYLNYTG